MCIRDRYAVVSLLSLFLVPDKELVLFYVLVLGYYPVLRVRLNNIRRGVLRWMAKFGCFNAAVVVMYAPVSYTHLDVYKRQVCRSPGRQRYHLLL